MKTLEIPLTKGQTALVDAVDCFVNKWKWYALPSSSGKTFYAARRDENRKHVYMHRLIMAAPKGSEVDHRDGNGLLNVRSNLRICTHAQNNQNKGVRSSNTSGYKGVSWHKGTSKYEVNIGVDGNLIYLGLFKELEQAALIYNEAALFHFGEYAQLNVLQGEENQVAKPPLKAKKVSKKSGARQQAISLGLPAPDKSTKKVVERKPIKRQGRSKMPPAMDSPGGPV